MAAKLAHDATEQAEAGHFRRAAELFAKAAEQEPSNAKHQEARAQCLLEAEEFQEALCCAERAWRLAPEWLPALATLARAQRNLGHLQDSLETLQKALLLADEEWRSELGIEREEVEALLQRHWREHHDVVLPGGPRIRQALECSYCHLAGELGPGGALWAAGAVLALDPWVKAEAFAARRLLELGAGTGAGGLALAARGAQVLMTDRENLLPLLKLNVDLNKELLSSAGGSADTATFDWLSPPEEIIRQDFDLVVGADLVYSFTSVEPFISAVSSLLQERDGHRAATRMIYAHFPRFPNLDAALRQALARKGLQSKVMPATQRTAVGQIPLDAMERVQLLDIRYGDENFPPAEELSMDVGLESNAADCGYLKCRRVPAHLVSPMTGDV